ncbi:hypothetical protein GGX14DRAFT_399653 [Mycena pura]|uniref:Uncharacterized protein n=1 Tax=Mycena pura TaxID=153505 RepID=A0AAD6Y590_9AGAR|nr:hypothetical protein GGX14DRAFT_399653 [Mycena pura]
MDRYLGDVRNRPSGGSRLFRTPTSYNHDNLTIRYMMERAIFAAGGDCKMDAKCPRSPISSRARDAGIFSDHLGYAGGGPLIGVTVLEDRNRALTNGAMFDKKKRGGKSVSSMNAHPSDGTVEIFVAFDFSPTHAWPSASLLPSKMTLRVRSKRRSAASSLREKPVQVNVRHRQKARLQEQQSLRGCGCPSESERREEGPPGSSTTCTCASPRVVALDQQTQIGLSRCTGSLRYGERAVYYESMCHLFYIGITRQTVETVHSYSLAPRKKAPPTEIHKVRRTNDADTP